MTPRWLPPVPTQLGEQRSSESAKKPCLSQLWPICSKRPSRSRNMFCAITGCSLVLEIQFSWQVPTLQDHVPTEKAVTSPTFLDDYVKLCKAGSPFMKFLCEAVGVPF